VALKVDKFASAVAIDTRIWPRSSAPHRSVKVIRFQLPDRSRKSVIQITRIRLLLSYALIDGVGVAMPIATLPNDSRSRFAGMLLTDKEWQKIRASFKAVGVDADRVLVELWLGKEPLPLRDGLPTIALNCDLTSHLLKALEPTPKQLTAKQSHTIEICNELIAWLEDPSNYSRIDPDTHWPVQFPRLAALTARTLGDLEALVAELKRCRGGLTAMDITRGKAISTTHSQFWKELTRVWNGNVGKDVIWSNWHLTNFLIACSEPFFPEDTWAVSAFFEH
jgi:hypothetical protein